MNRFSGVTQAAASGIAIAVILLFSPVPARAQLGVRWDLSEVTVDFALSEGHPLVKSKFNLYDAVIQTTEQLDQNAGLLPELNVDTYRIELGWGRGRTGLGTHSAVGGTMDQLTYDFAPLDHVVETLKEQNVLLHGAYTYTPGPLQDPAVADGAETVPPVSLEKWQEVIRSFVRHHQEAGLPFGTHEVWNEPDGRANFFSGGESDYQELYAATVKAIREVDPDAVVAGPAMAPGLYWKESFPEFVADNGLPLDFLTFHVYGSAELGVAHTRRISEILAGFPSLRTTALSMDEWDTADAYVPCADDARQTHWGASTLLHDFMVFLTEPELVSVSHSWYQDPESRLCKGLVTGDGHRKAVFNAWKIYGQMPVDRKHVEIFGGPLEAMASADHQKASLVIWNPSAFDRWVDGVHLRNVPFFKGDIRVYRIDSEHASFLQDAEEELTPVETFVDTFFFETPLEWTWEGAVPPGGVLYFEITNRTGQSELAPAEVGEVIRINRDYPARGRTDSYADFDRKTWIARLGMMNDPGADQKVGVIARGLPAELNLTVEAEGLQRANEGSLLGLRVDYRVNGEFTKSILYHGPYEGTDLYDASGLINLPWGLEPRPDETVAVSDLAAFGVPLASAAPAGWSGEAQLTFLMNSAGEGARAKFIVRPGSGTP